MHIDAVQCYAGRYRFFVAVKINIEKYFAVWWENYYLSVMEMESVKINRKIVDRVRRYVKSTGQTISGCINIALAEYLDQKEGERVLTDYASSMGEFLMKKSNKKKK